MAEENPVELSFQKQVELGLIKCDACSAKGTRLLGINNLKHHNLCDDCYMARFDIRPNAKVHEIINYYNQNKDEYSE